MREIKFRGLRTDGNGWVYGFYTSNKKSWIGSFSFENYYHTEVIPDSVGQFTGLQDSKGVDVYEGDILSDKVTTDEGVVDSKQQVFWNEPTGSWHLDNSFNQDKSCSTELWQELNDFDYEIIGNINTHKL